MITAIILRNHVMSSAMTVFDRLYLPLPLSSYSNYLNICRQCFSDTGICGRSKNFHQLSYAKQLFISAVVHCTFKMIMPKATKHFTTDAKIDQKITEILLFVFEVNRTNLHDEHRRTDDTIVVTYIRQVLTVDIGNDNCALTVSKQAALLSQTDRAMLRVCQYLASIVVVVVVSGMQLTIA